MGRLFVGEGRLGAIRVWLLSVVLVVVTGLVVLAGVVSPVERALAADGLELGLDGYFSTLSAGATPVASSGWASTRRIVFGKQKDVTYSSTSTYDSKQVSGGYKTLAKGEVASEAGRSFNKATVPTNDWSASSTTSVAANEALLWADDVVTAGFKFDTNASFRNSFDSETASYKSNLAVVSDAVGAANYSSFEQELLLRAGRQVEGVCTAARSAGCESNKEPTSPEFSPSVNAYSVFPLSIGDVNKYFNHTSGSLVDNNLRCKTNIDAGNSGNCANGASGSWLRSALWAGRQYAFYVRYDGYPNNSITNNAAFGLRPALHLGLDDLILSADVGDQSQAGVGDVQLTFVDETQGAPTGVVVDVADVGGEWVLDLEGSSDLAGDRLGWKLVDPQATDGTVVASGNTSGGNMVLGDLDVDRDYSLYVWGQEDGSATTGWSNKATKPVIRTVRVNSHGLNQVGAGDHSVVVTGQISGGVVVTLPAGFVLDGNRAGDVSEWVGDNANLQVNTALVESDERVVVRLKDISGSPLLLSSGGRSLAYELRVNQQASLLDSQSGGLLVAAGSSDTPVSATLQARFTGGVVPQSAKSGNYYGQLTFQVAVEDQS